MEKAIRTCEVAGVKYTFHTLRNDGSLTMMRQLIDLKNIFAKQLPKMPKEYIVRLIFDRKHESIVIKDPKSKIFGGICYRVFPTVSLAEIVFLAVMSERQIKGFGTRIMNELKTEMQRREIRFLMTCADNLAIGYFQKQGFHKDILMPPCLYKGYLKDYEGSTLMECLLDKRVNYHGIYNVIKRARKELLDLVKSRVSNQIVYQGVNRPPTIFQDLRKKMGLLGIYIFCFYLYSEKYSINNF